MELKIALLLILAGVSNVFAIPGYSQVAKVSLDMKNTSLEQVMDKIESQSEFYFIFNQKQIDVNRVIDIQAENKLITDILPELFKGTNVNYLVFDRKILLTTDPLENNLLAVASNIEQQQVRVTGIVTDKNGAPLPGVNVVVTGTSQGMITDIAGKYTIEVPQGSKSLTFTFIGMEPQKINIGTLTQINVTMVESAVGLEEVIVVGYGTQKKVNLTGSVSSVSSSELSKIHVGQTSMALQGIVPGVTVTQRSGQPGMDRGSIRIRGIGTLGDSNPFILVDGVETDFNNIDPNDIENISILKDAASASIYGSRAANGVILITTKRSKTNTFGIDYNTYIGWQAPTDLPEIVNAIDHMEMINEAYTNVGKTPLYTQAYINEYKTLGPADRDKYPDTDWQKSTITENGFTQNHYLGLNAGFDRIRILSSFNYFDQNGNILNTNYKRYNFRLNSDIQLNKQISSSFDLFFSRTNLTEPSYGAGGVFGLARGTPANLNGVLSNGKYGEAWNGWNPIAKAKDGGLHTTDGINAILNFTLKYKPADWLTVHLNYAPKYYEPHDKKFQKTIQTYKGDLITPGFADPAKSSLNESFSRDWFNNLSATIMADKTFAGVHQVTILAGLQQEDYENSYISAYREVFIVPEYQVINSGNRLNELTGGSGSHWSLRSFFGRLNYGYKQKYLFEANVRYDGSSRFAKGNRYSVFPSVSAGWRISEEEFMQPLSNIITYLKMRGSWGQLGNQNIGLYPYSAYINIGQNNYIFGDVVTTGAALNDMANSEIKWETTEASNIGIDVILWSKLTITGDYYYRKTRDILLQLDIPKIIGLRAPYQNAGIVENKGWELSVGYHDKIGQLSYDISANISDVRNKILDLRGVKRTGLTVNLEGHEINSIYGYQSLGFFKDSLDVATSATQFGKVAPGDIKYLDVNDDDKIDNLDQKIIGSTIPRYTFSSNLNLNYKGFDFSMLLQGVGKADGYLYNYAIMPFAGGILGGNCQEQHKDRWTPTNTNAKFPRFAFNEPNNQQNSTFWVKNAAYLRVKNIQLGYTLPSNLLKKVSIKSLRIYISGQNLYTFDKFWDGNDVEAPISTGDWYPQVKVYNLGLDVKF